MSRPRTLGAPGSACPDFHRSARVTRRDLLRVGTLGPFGLGLADLLTPPAVAAAPAADLGPKPTAKACILLFMWGGPSQLETWDPKPDAPAEVRGEFGAIPTSVPGLRIGEHFPRLAKLAHKYAVVRSMTHDDPAHLSTVHLLMTGRLAPRPKSDAEPPSRNDAPALGSVLAKFGYGGGPVPPAVTVPWVVSHPAAPGGVAPGQNAGWFGSGFDPFVAAGDPNTPGFRLGGLSGSPELTVGRLSGRRELLSRLDGPGAGAAWFTGVREKAFGMLSSPAAEAAFDLGREPPAVRDRYGRHTHGQSVLLARRLVEAGTRLVTVNWPNDGQNFWDTHGNNFPALKTRLMPPADQAFSALLEDLDRRGMLDETLVVWVGEFGRNPKINKAAAGREHWPGCYSAVLAGGGVRGGAVYGASDRMAARPKANPVSPPDLTATIYHALGVNPGQMIADRLGRPVPLTEGTPVTALFG